MTPGPPIAPVARVSSRPIWSILALALLVRWAAALPLSFHHADELWQYTEPAYHLAVGPWVVAWEMRDGIRTWLIPVALAPWMAIGHAIGAHLLLPRLVLALGSLTVVGAAMALGARISRRHQLIAGLVAAIWFELVYFAPRPLSEPIALALMMGAVWLLVGREPATRHRFAAGLLIGLAFAARFQLAPTLLTLVAWQGRTSWRECWLPLIAGGLAGLAIDGAVDLAMGQVPLRWMVENFRINLIERKSDLFGTSPPGWYLAELTRLWRWATIPILLLATVGARRYPVLLAIALVHLAAHSLIPHKEYRFILPTTALLVVLAGIGTADLLHGVRPRAERWATVAAVTAWAATSAALAVGPHFGREWVAMRNAALVMREAGQVEGACGFALYQQGRVLTAAYAVYDRPTPIYVLQGVHAAEEARRYARAFNRMMAAEAQGGALPPGYTIRSCHPASRPGKPSNRCLFVREGGCSGPSPVALEINHVARRAGE